MSHFPPAEAAKVRHAVTGTLEALEETMLQCDELQVYTRWGGSGDSGAACALSRLYANLEERLRLHMGLERALARGGAT